MTSPFVFALGLLSTSATPSGFETAEASSALAGPWEATRVLDVDRQTAWCEGQQDEGVGAVLTLVLAEPVDAQGLLVRVGAPATGISEDVSLPRTVQIVVKDGDTVLHETQATLERKDGFQPIPVQFAGGRRVELRIVEVHPGRRRKDTCISDVLISASLPQGPPESVAPLPPIPGQRVVVREHPRDFTVAGLASALSADLYALAVATADVRSFQSACVGANPRRAQAKPPAPPNMAPMLFDAFALDTVRFYRRDALRLSPALPADETTLLISGAEEEHITRVLLDTGDTRICYVYLPDGRLKGAVEAHAEGASHLVVDLRIQRDLIQAVDRYRASATEDVLTWSRTTFNLAAGKAPRRRR